MIKTGMKNNYFQGTAVQTFLFTLYKVLMYTFKSNSLALDAKRRAHAHLVYYSQKLMNHSVKCQLHTRQLDAS